MACASLTELRFFEARHRGCAFGLDVCLGGLFKTLSSYMELYWIPRLCDSLRKNHRHLCSLFPF